MTDYKALPDTTLISLLKKSDGGAFIEIFQRYRSVLLLFSYHRLKNTEASKALIFETFTELWMKRESLNQARELRTLLITMIKNKISKK